MSILIAGFVLGLSLIVAVGPQNAYVIKMGVKRDHIGAIVAVCLLSDVILINAGVAGVGFLVDRFPLAITVIKYLGAAYLIYFSFTCFKEAFSHRQESITIQNTQPHHSNPKQVEPGQKSAAGGASAVSTLVKPQSAPVRPWLQPVLGALALTWLNPLAYVDVLVMLGGIANSYGDARWIFGLGALCASALWFPLVGFGAAKLSPVLARPQTWQIINTAIGFLMIALTVKLLTH